MATPYDDIIDDLAKNDPEFLKLQPEQQDSLVEQLAQEKIGKIPNSGALLNRAAGGLKNRSINALIGGPIFAGAPAESRPEDVVPGMVQAGTDYAFNVTPQGRAIGSIPGVKYGSTVGATTAAEGLKQGVKQLRGEPHDYSKIGETALTTAGVEGLFRGGEQALFKTQIGKDLIGGAKGRLGTAIKYLDELTSKNPELKVAKTSVLDFMDTVMKKVNPIGSQASALKRMRTHIASDKVAETLGASEISNLKNTFSDIAQFNPERSGMIKNKAANVASKELTGHTGKMLEGLGEFTGTPIKATMKEAANVQKTYGKSQAKKGIGDIIGRGITSSALGGAVGYQQHDPATGALAAIGSFLGQSEPVRNLLYNLIVKSGASKAARVGITQAVTNRD